MAKWGQPYQANGRAGAGNLSVSQLKTEADFVRKLSSLRRGRQSLEREWKLNLAFYQGNQYVSYNRHSGALDYLPTEDGEKPRYRIRIVSNQIQTGAHSLLSKLTKTKPVISAVPGSGSVTDRRAAQVAEMLYQHWWHDLKLQEKLAEALLWGIVAGQGFWKITWDKHAGKSMRFMVGPDGNPILDDDLREIFTAELQKMNIQPQEITMNLGDIRVEAMSPFDVFLDPAAHVFDDCQYAFCGHSMDPDEIYTRWGKRLEPDSVGADAATVLPWKTSEDRVEPTVKKIWIGYFRPGPALPKGRYVVFSENPQMILYDGPWPYPINELPLVKFPGVRVPGQVYDDAVTTSARPLQKELNRTISQIVEYKNLTIRPRIIAPVGGLAQKITNEPGQVVQYNPIGGLKPEMEKLPAMPPYVFEHLRDISGRLRDIFGLTEVTEGSVPPNVEAGIAIDLLQEMASDRWAPTIQTIETSLARAGRVMISLAQKYYIEPRLLKLHGDGGRIKVHTFQKADIDANVDFHADVGSGLPRTRAGRQARIEWMMEKGLIRPDQAWKYADLADMKGISAQFSADEDHAERENDMLLKGEPLNPVEFMHAQAALQQGINPNTGQPLTSMQEAEQILKEAVVKPGPADHHQTHYDTHRLVMVGTEFRNYPPDVQERYQMHLELTRMMMGGPPKPEPEAPRTSLTMKATVDADTAAKVLQAAGVEADPNELRNPPLESAVYDSVDKPDADAAGNDPLAEQELMQHNIDTAAHSAVLAAAKARGETAKADREERRADPRDPLDENRPGERGTA